MSAPQDVFTRTEADALAFERHFGPDFDDDHRPTRAELDRDEYEAAAERMECADEDYGDTGDVA